MRAFQYVKPPTLRRPSRSCPREPEATVLAGGTNLVDLMKLGVLRPGMLVDVAGLGMDAIEHRQDGSTFVEPPFATATLPRRGHPAAVPRVESGDPRRCVPVSCVARRPLAATFCSGTRCVYFQDITSRATSVSLVVAARPRKGFTGTWP